MKNNNNDDTCLHFKYLSLSRYGHTVMNFFLKKKHVDRQYGLQLVPSFNYLRNMSEKLCDDH